MPSRRCAIVVALPAGERIDLPLELLECFSHLGELGHRGEHQFLLALRDGGAPSMWAPSGTSLATPAIAPRTAPLPICT